eukprot:CAMPEP_0178378556 /NCGR_PEP_ID=MMETSP0689_2-20121128/4489_1 /TAXON_ID=160604 /ORGANISM="Amphidinium massartii, Strain CS-259" /LENGTH=1144 /DNA_ID=CAMNT_0019998633 /DNA_START=59 /DNA_END=3493 /DNA_ORIENTATION=-
MTVASAFPGPVRPKQAYAKKPVDYGDLSKYLQRNGKKPIFGTFRVKVEYVMIRSMPSLKSPIKGRLRQGDILDGEVRDEYLLLSTELSTDSLTNGDGRWVLIDGASVPSLGIGLLLERMVPEPQLKQAFGRALEIRLPENLHATHQLQLVSRRPKMERKEQCGAGRTMMVHDLPTETAFEMRLVQVVDGSTVAESEWVDVETVEYEPDDEGRRSDLMGRPRSRCTQCSCTAYCQDNTISLNVDWTSCRCVCCGCSVEAHMLVEDERRAAEQEVEEKEKEEERARRKEREQRDAQMTMALAVTKESLMTPWSKYDVSPDATSWPQLDVEIEEVVAWSDLHADMGANMEHLQVMSPCPKTALILAGDIGTALKSIESSLRVLQSKFGAVFFVPGNHELWVDKAEGLSSIHKFMTIMELCEKLGVHTRPAFVSRNCAVCPLFSWYKDNLIEGFERSKANIPFDIQTSWPWDLIGSGDSNDAQKHEIADFFLSLNERRLKIAPTLEEQMQGSGTGRSSSMLHLITFSHFVPRQECYPGRLQLGGVMGCREIEEQLRSCEAKCHVFGHSHIAVDRHIEGVRYVQHPLGYPNDYHRKTKPMRIWADASALMQAIKKVSCCSLASMDSTMSEGPPRRRSDVISSDGKWLVWNALWASANAAAAREVHGEAKQACNKRAEDDRRKLLGHKEEVLRTGALSEDAVRAIEAMAMQAGKAAALKANEKQSLSLMEVKGPENAPAGIEEKLWDNIVRAARLAAQAVNFCLLDQALLRKRNDEVVHMTPSNWQQFKNKPMQDAVQKRFEEVFSKMVVGLDSDSEEPRIKEELPEATLCEPIRKAMCSDIAQTQKRFTERPPGHWQEDAIWDPNQRLNREGEMELRRLMEWDHSKAAGLSEQWAAHAEVKDVELLVVSCEDESQEVRIQVCTSLTVGELKERIMQQVRRGPRDGMELFTSDGTRLLDHMLLNSLEVESLERGLMLSGVEFGPGKPISVRILHVEEEEELTVVVEDTCRIREVRQAIAKKLGEPDLAKCVVVKNAATASGLAPEEDDDFLFGREELQFVGRSLACPGSEGEDGDIEVTIHIDREMELMLETKVSRGSSIAALKEQIAAEDPTGMLAPEHFRLQVPGTNEILDESSIVSSTMSELEICCS